MDKEPSCRPPPKPPYVLDANGKVIGIMENMVQKTRPPLKSLEYTVVLIKKEKI